jgi:hypothetical protein
MPLNVTELLERLARVRAEVTAIEKLLLPLGKSQARKLNDVRENLNEIEAAQLTNREAK